MASPDALTDDEAVLEPISPEQETILRAVEDEILERIKDGDEDDLTVNETLADVLEEVVDEFTSVTFREYMQNSTTRKVLPLLCQNLGEIIILQANSDTSTYRHNLTP